MVPDKFDMVDMDGIDIIESQGVTVPGLYEKLVNSITQCRYQCLYNWKFNGIIIPPTYVEMVATDETVSINGGVTIDVDDVIHVYSLEPTPVVPEIIPLIVDENGEYTVPADADGFNPVTVDVPSYTPVISPLSISENGIYTPPSGVDGYSPITVNVSGGAVILHETVYSTSGEFSYSKEIIIPKTSTYKITAQTYSNGFSLKINGVEQPYTLNVSADYTYLYYAEVSLSIGDTVTLSCTSSGRSIVTFVITEMN